MNDTKIYTIQINGVEKSISNIEELYKVLNQLQDKVAELQNKNIDTGNLQKRIEAIRNLSEGVDLSQVLKPIQQVEEEIDRLSRKKVTIKTDNIERTAKDIQSAFRKVKVNVDTTELDKPFNVVINGKLTGFTNMSEAAEKLRAELNRLTLAGKQDTPEFNTAQDQLVLYQNTINKTNAMVDKLVGGSMARMVKQIQSLTGLTSIAGGLQGLFGNTPLDETIQKFASLSLIMQGVAQIEKEVAQEGSLLNKIFSIIPTGIDKTITFLGKLEKELSVKTDALIDPLFAEQIDAWNEAIKEFKENVKDIPNTDFGKIFAFEDVNPTEVFKQLDDAIEDAYSNLDIEKALKLDKIKENVQSAFYDITSEDFSIGTKEVSGQELIAKYREEWEKTGKVVEVETSRTAKAAKTLRNAFDFLKKDSVGKYITGIVTSIASLGVGIAIFQALGKVIEWVTTKFNEWWNATEIATEKVVKTIKNIIEVNKQLQQQLSKDTSLTTIERLNKQYQALLSTLRDIQKETSKLKVIPTVLTDESRAATPGIPTYTMQPKAEVVYTQQEGQLKSFIEEFNKLDLSKVNKQTDEFFKKWTTKENLTLIKKSGEYVGETLGNAINDSFNAALDIYNQLKRYY